MFRSQRLTIRSFAFAIAMLVFLWPGGCAANSLSPAPVPVDAAPQADFFFDHSRGQAPLAVQFINRSTNATTFLWDFGDGATSSEVNPSHTYTRAGQWTVRLTAEDSDRTRGADHSMSSPPIQVQAGPLADLRVEPPPALEIGTAHQLTLSGLDAHGNAIDPVDASWSVAPGAGYIADGALIAGITAGGFPSALAVKATGSGGELARTFDVTILPGPLASVSIVPERRKVFTGDATSLTVHGVDAYGNAVELTESEWQLSIGDGAISEDLSGAVFTAGREAGTALISVRSTDGRSIVPMSTALEIEQGACAVRRVRAEWKADWRAIGEAVYTPGSPLVRTTLPPTFDLSWRSGELPGGIADRALLTAQMQVVVQRSGPVMIKIGADDGYRLRLGGRVIAESIGFPDPVLRGAGPAVSSPGGAQPVSWPVHSYQERTFTQFLTPGVHTLDLEYFEWEGDARLLFEIDPDAITWDQASDCTGRYSIPPGAGIVVMQPGDTAAGAALRFGLPESLFQLVYLGDDALLFQPESVSHSRVVLVLGMNSALGCGLASPPSTLDSAYGRWASIMRSVQLEAWDRTGRASSITPDDVRIFSYSGNYESCPGPDGTRMTMPAYKAEDTCTGVEQAAAGLRVLLEQMVSEDSEAEISLVGHSLGGMVAVFLAATLGQPDLLSHIHSVVTIDSPLRGFPVTGAEIGLGGCGTTTATYQDITDNQRVVPAILSLANQAVAGRLTTIRSSFIGSTIPGAERDFYSTCGGSYGLLSILRDVPAHTCAMDDAASLRVMAAAVNAVRS